ncbi:MAG: beta-galactosidase, partial [Parcubacteria group bacterium]
FLDNLKSWGGNTVVTDVPWQAIEKSEGTFDFSKVDPFMQHAADRDIKLIIALDAGILFGQDPRQPSYQAAPKWLFDKYPEARSMDYDGDAYPVLSFTHTQANAAFGRFIRTAVEHFTNTFGDAVIAYSPNFNNQMETRYMQQQLKWQDYGPSARQAYAVFLRDTYKTIDALNSRWQTSFSDFAQVSLDEPRQGQAGFDPKIEPSYIDLMRFRENAIVKAISSAAETVHQAGGQVFVHFGEVITKVDAIFTVPLELLAESADIVAVDGHHLTADGLVTDPSITGLIVSHARAHGVAVIFEDSVEVAAAPEFDKRRDFLVQECIRWAQANGADGIGFANFLQRFDDQGIYTFQDTLPQTLKETKTFKQKPVALYASRWLQYTTYGTTDYRIDGKAYDFYQSNVQGMFKLLEDAGIPVAVLSDVAIANGMLDQYDTLVLPYQLVVPEETYKKILAFHDRGGNLIQDVRFAEFSLRGPREQGQLDDLFAVDVGEPGQETKANLKEILGALAPASEIIVGDAKLQTNRTAGFFSTNKLTPRTGTKLYVSTSGEGGLVAINKGQNTAQLGFMPGLLYLQRSEAKVQDSLRQLVAGVVEELRR